MSRRLPFFFLSVLVNINLVWKYTAMKNENSYSRYLYTVNEICVPRGGLLVEYINPG